MVISVKKKNKQTKIDIIVQAKGFTENFGNLLMNITLVGSLCFLGIHYMVDNL